MSDLAGIALGGIIAAGSALVVVLVESRMRRRERRANVLEKRRQDAATLVGPVLSALRDLEPNANVGALRGNPRAAEALRQKWAGLLDAQGGLEVLGAMHPDSEAGRLCDSIIVDSTDLLTRLHLAITDGQAQTEQWWAEVTQLRDSALADAKGLVRAVLEQPA